MSVLEVTQAISKMSKQERREVQLYLSNLRHSTRAWKRATAKRIRDVQAGKFTTLEELEARIAPQRRAAQRMALASSRRKFGSE